MFRAFLAVLIIALAGCGDSPPPPAPAPSPVAKPAPPSAPAPEAKATETPKPDPNRELAVRVKRALEEDSKIQAGGIDVTAADGVVTLWGTTTSDSERSRAEQAAAKVDGVKSVSNKLSVVRGS